MRIKNNSAHGIIYFSYQILNLLKRERRRVDKKKGQENEILKIILFFSDRESPVIVCPNNQTINNTFGQATAVSVWAGPESIDKSGEILTVTCSKSSGSQFDIGVTEVICKANDPYGNHVKCAFTIQVKGKQWTFVLNELDFNNDNVRSRNDK